MKRFILKLSFFLILLIIIDYTFGVLGKKALESATSGDTKREYLVANGGITDEIVVLGSSRAVHHYHPTIIEENTGLSCYNAGVDGNGIILMYGRLSLIMKYHTPKLVIYDITKDFDLNKNDNTKYLGHLKYFYNDKTIKEIFSSVDKLECYKMYSNMYKYNSKFLQLIADNFHSFSTNIKGYKPIHHTMDYVPKSNISNEETELDSLKIGYLEKLILLCKDKSQLIFVISPSYFEDNQDYSPLINLCAKHNISLLDYGKDTTFVGKRRFFGDTVHMNNDGATDFSRIIANEINKLLNKNK